MYIRKVVRTGDSLSICIPRVLQRKFHIQRADFLAIQVVDESSFLISKVDPRRVPELTGYEDADTAKNIKSINIE